MREREGLAVVCIVEIVTLHESAELLSRRDRRVEKEEDL